MVVFLTYNDCHRRHHPSFQRNKRPPRPVSLESSPKPCHMHDVFQVVEAAYSKDLKYLSFFPLLSMFCNPKVIQCVMVFPSSISTEVAPEAGAVPSDYPHVSLSIPDIIYF